MNEHPLTGHPVRYFCEIYVIEGANYLGDIDLVRFDAERRVWQRTSVPPSPTPNRPWGLVGKWHHKRLRWAIINAEKLHPWVEIRSKSARHWRRAKAHRGVLRRFFRMVQDASRIQTIPKP